ncbi:MAG: hypothetical protein FWD58_10445 [Firmicutes bacterium]|nr:hypothetical protein [Bacillota bacterium]
MTQSADAAIGNHMCPTIATVKFAIQQKRLPDGIGLLKVLVFLQQFLRLVKSGAVNDGGVHIIALACSEREIARIFCVGQPRIKRSRYKGFAVQAVSLRV